MEILFSLKCFLILNSKVIKNRKNPVREMNQMNQNSENQMNQISKNSENPVSQISENPVSQISER